MDLQPHTTLEHLHMGLCGDGTSGQWHWRPPRHLSARALSLPRCSVGTAQGWQQGHGKEAGEL